MQGAQAPRTPHTAQAKFPYAEGLASAMLYSQQDKVYVCFSQHHRSRTLLGGAWGSLEGIGAFVPITIRRFVVELIKESKVMGVYPLRHYRWPNGLQALLVQNPISPVAALLVQYTVGSAWEEDNQRGLAHFFEHMMFRETDKLADGEFDRTVSECGGVGLNAYTSYDTTAYHVSVPADQLEKVVGLEADRMVNLRLTPEQIEKERGAVLGEIHMYQDMPSEQHWHALMDEAFPHHPYRHPIIGYPEQVEGFQAQDFIRFYHDHYAPNRAVVVVAGGFDNQTVLDILDRAFSGLKPGSPRPVIPPPEQPLAAPVHKTITHGKITSETLFLAAHAPGITHADTPALSFLAWLLAGGQSSPLHRRLVLETGLATHVSANLMDVEWTLASPSLFLIDVSLQQGKTADQAEAEVNSILEDLGNNGIAPEEYERARNQLRLNHYSSLRSNMALARYLGGHYVACGDPLFGDQLHQAMVEVTPERLTQVLKTYWLNSPRVYLAQRPE